MHWTESYRHKWIYKGPAKMCHQTVPYIHLHQQQSCKHQAPQPGVATITQPSSATQMWSLSTRIPGLLQDNAVAVSDLSTKGNLIPLHEFVLALTFLLPANLTLSAVGPPCPPCQIIPWSKITTAEQLQFEFTLHPFLKIPEILFKDPSTRNPTEDIYI